MHLTRNAFLYGHTLYFRAKNRGLGCSSVVTLTVTVFSALQAKCCQHQKIRQTMVPVVTVKFLEKRAAKTKKAGFVMPLPFDDADM